MLHMYRWGSSNIIIDLRLLLHQQLDRWLVNTLKVHNISKINHLRLLERGVVRQKVCALVCINWKLLIFEIDFKIDYLEHSIFVTLGIP